MASAVASTTRILHLSIHDPAVLCCKLVGYSESTFLKSPLLQGPTAQNTPVKCNVLIITQNH